MMYLSIGVVGGVVTLECIGVFWKFKKVSLCCSCKLSCLNKKAPDFHKSGAFAFLLRGAE
jgi:hypothetical protein